MGRQLYRNGILPDGSPLIALRLQGSTARGAEAACANCHRSSGYGSIEGRIIVPPLAGAVLFSPGPFAADFKGPSLFRSQVERFRVRGAYDEGKLARALHMGVDADGTPLQALMPRYPLDAKAVSALAAYLRHLSEEPVAGVEGGVLHLGTVITPDAPPARREAMLDVLRAYAAERGKWGMAWRLHVWRLTGPPQGWGAQLEEHYRRQPVFALLSGAGGAEWGPVHRFCESRAMACVLPNLEAAPERDGDYYSVYFSPGIALEARLLAHHLNVGPAPPRRLIQVVADDAGRRAAAEVKSRLAAGFPVEQLSPDEYAAGLDRFSAEDVVVLWLHPQDLSSLADKPPPPGELFLSALLASPDQFPPPPSWKGRLRYLSLFDPLSPLRVQTTLRPWLARNNLPATELQARGDAYGACNFFNAAVTMVQKQLARGVAGPLTRERVLEALEEVLTVFRDDGAPFYWYMSLGPGQRIPVRGGELLRYRGDGLEAGERVVP